jgi:hypothetical protein
LQGQLRSAESALARAEKKVAGMEENAQFLRYKAAQWDQVEVQLAVVPQDDDHSVLPYNDILERILAEHTGRTEALTKALELLERTVGRPGDKVDPTHPEWFVEAYVERLIEQYESARNWAQFVEREITSIHYRLFPHLVFVDPTTTLEVVERALGSVRSVQQYQQRRSAERSWEQENRRLDAERDRLGGFEHMGG